MPPATLIIADDHPLFRAALREVVSKLLPAANIVEAASLDALQSALQAHGEADLILLDLRMPGANGFSCLMQLRAQYPAIPVAVVSAAEDAAIMRRAIDLGASAFIPKSAGIATIGEALRAVLDGSVWLPQGLPEAIGEAEERDREMAGRLASLTPQQLRVFQMLAEGRLNKQIAADLALSEATVKAHVTAILRKLGVYRRTQAAVLAQKLLLAENGNAPLLEDLDE